MILEVTLKGEKSQYVGMWNTVNLCFAMNWNKCAVAVNLTVGKEKIALIGILVVTYLNSQRHRKAW